MDGQLSIFDLVRTRPDMNPYTLTNASGSVKLNFFRSGDRVSVEMVYDDKMMICDVLVDELKEVTNRL